MTIELQKLPYDMDALEPCISAETLSYHYGKHHRAYVDKLNKLIADSPLADLSLEEIIARSREDGSTDIANNASQAWNHAFLWESMSPGDEATPEGRLKELVESSFGDLESFRELFRKAALSQFGSGWAWLVLDGSRLRILTTANADSPLGTGMVPLLTLDVWEHAYYIDYRNDRGQYIETFLDKLINWRFAAANLENAAASKAA